MCWLPREEPSWLGGGGGGPRRGRGRKTRQQRAILYTVRRPQQAAPPTLQEREQTCFELCTHAHTRGAAACVREGPGHRPGAVPGRAEEGGFGGDRGGKGRLSSVRTTDFFLKAATMGEWGGGVRAKSCAGRRKEGCKGGGQRAKEWCCARAGGISSSARCAPCAICHAASGGWRFSHPCGGEGGKSDQIGGVRAKLGKLRSREERAEKGRGGGLESEEDQAKGSGTASRRRTAAAST